MTPSKKEKLKPFMTYINDADYVKLRKFAKTKKLTMAQVLREGLSMRVAVDNPYLRGFNEGLDASIKIISGHHAAQMRFPSGQSFADLMADEIMKQRLRSDNENIKG
jgi:hypothetical protein